MAVPVAVCAAVTSAVGVAAAVVSSKVSDNDSNSNAALPSQLFDKIASNNQAASSSMQDTNAEEAACVANVDGDDSDIVAPAAADADTADLDTADVDVDVGVDPAAHPRTVVGRVDDATPDGLLVELGPADFEE